jgi:hypothetical protein
VKGVFSFWIGFLTQLLAPESNHWAEIMTKLEVDVFQQNMLFFPIQMLGIRLQFSLLLLCKIMDRTKATHQICAILIQLEKVVTKTL